MSPIEIVAFLLALAAAVIAWRAVQRGNEIVERLQRAQSTLYETRADMRNMQQGLETRITHLEVALKSSTGQMRFAPSIRLSALYEIEPRAQDLLAALHIGGCAHCAVDEEATLAEAVEQNGADLDRILSALNNLPPGGQLLELRSPNVHFEI